MDRPVGRLLGVMSGIILMAGCPGLGGDPSESAPTLGHYPYAHDHTATTCPLGARDGPAGASNDEHTENGIAYAVRTPANYDPAVVHPLLMVFAPAGLSRFQSERLTALTFAATEAGFVVAYADARRLSLRVIAELGSIPARVGRRWCVDQQRVYLTGHSDGGTVSLALALLHDTPLTPAGIAPSGAGFRKADLEAMSCPDGLSALIMHAANDRLFPGYGAEVAAWLADCQACRPRAAGVPAKDRHGCFSYAACRSAATLTYCEGRGTHREWPGLNSVLLSFFRDLDARAP